MQALLNDHACMAEALRLAALGLHTVRKNPRVGCVIARDNTIIARGYHVRAGGPHAEIHALESASEPVEDATAYVTLEPCAHEGKTPPCTEALVAAGLAKVVAATRDPNPLVDGKGLARLREQGVETRCDVLAKEARELNKGFFKRMQTGRPYITVKSAISLDGRTALASGESQWVTGEAARLDVQRLRARSCAILTGIGTVAADDPKLTVRASGEALGLSQAPEQPLRVVLDSGLRISGDAQVLHAPGQTLLYTGSQDAGKAAELQGEQVKVISLGQGSLDLVEVMRDLGSREINEVLVEAGATLVGSLLGQGLVDEMILYLAPHLIGTSGRGLAKLPLISNMQDRLGMQVEEITVIGEDIRLRAYPVPG